MRLLGTLVALMLFAMPGTASACPDWQLPPSFGQIDLVEGFPNDPFYRSITAGGSYSLARCFNNPNWNGSVAAAPDFDIYYDTSGRSTLTIIVESNYDTMLLINDPSGNWWFDDDSAGNGDPGISIPNAPPGLYDVWVGVYGGGSGLPGTLILTERY